MTEPSPEATVAGAAAATAVEELHAREAVVETAVDASLDAMQARDEASTASETANVAIDVASEAAFVAASVAEEVETARVNSDVALGATGDLANVVAQLHERDQKREAELAEIRQMLTAQTLASGPVSTVEDVNVSGGTAGNQGVTTGNGTGTGDASTTETTGKAGKRGLRSFGTNRRSSGSG